MRSHRHSARAESSAAVWGALAFLTDTLPPRLRYGYVHRFSRAVLAAPLSSMPESHASAESSPPLKLRATSEATAKTTTCILAADDLDVGGIGTVIETLARGLGDHGVRPIVVCPGGGVRAARLRDAGVDVIAVSDDASAREAIRAAAPDVIQSHSAPPYLEQAALRSGVPLVPVMHNTEIHYTRARWSAFGTLMAAAVTGVAVSETVRAFHLQHLGDRTPIVVVPNGAPRMRIPPPSERQRARDALSRALGVDIGADVVFVCLARYDSQKNITGLVASFGAAIERSDEPLRLVCAGDPSDWVEVRRADAVRRSRPSSDRIHLLGDSDAQALLAATDAFVLDSFFEGWPVAATEAAAFGHPLLLSDVGGARELIERDPLRSVLIPNAVGDPRLVSDRRVRSARRSARHQSNAVALQDAADLIARTVRTARSSYPAAGTPPPVARATVGAMVAQHAAVIRGAAGSTAR